jgi:ribonuclease-3
MSETLPQGVDLAADILDGLESRLGYRFKDRSLLVRALTHRSYAHEHEGECGTLPHNESLEFLGDAVLGFLISSRIFRRFPELNEGELSKIKAYLVSAVNLVKLAEHIRLGDYLRLSRGEEKTGGRQKRAILADAYEAALAAIYLDGGIEAASSFLERQLGDLLDTPAIDLTYGDFKSALQERLHDVGRPEPSYRVVDELGPDHEKVFIVQLLIEDQIVAQASGKTKKEAQQEAARIALQSLDDL